MKPLYMCPEFIFNYYEGESFEIAAFLDGKLLNISKYHTV